MLLATNSRNRPNKTLQENSSTKRSIFFCFVHFFKVSGEDINYSQSS